MTPSFCRRKKRNKNFVGKRTLFTQQEFPDLKQKHLRMYLWRHRARSHGLQINNISDERYSWLENPAGGLVGSGGSFSVNGNLSSLYMKKFENLLYKLVDNCNWNCHLEMFVNKWITLIVLHMSCLPPHATFALRPRYS
jgi:hypothetical protein